MLTCLFSLSLSESLWTAKTSGLGKRYYTLNRDEFERILLSTQDTGDEFRIQLIDYTGGLSYYKLKPFKLYAKDTLSKYPNQLYAFKGYKEDDKTEMIGLVWCFRILKQFWMIREATVEIRNSFDEYVFYDPRNILSRTLHEVDNLNETVERILHEVSDDDGPGDHEQIKLHIDPLTRRMDHVKVIRFLPFPTVEYNRLQRTLRGNTMGFAKEDQKKVIFTQLAASVLFANFILLPQLSVRLEMLFCTDLVLFEINEKIKYLDYADQVFSARSPLPYKNLKKFVLEYFRDDRVDLSHYIHAALNQGLSVVRALKQDDVKWKAFTSDNSFAYHGKFELAFVHEIGHQLGAHHTYTYQTNGGFYATEVGSGVSIMAYPGRSNGHDVEGQSYPYYTVQNLDEMTRFLAITSFVNSEPKEDLPPVIDDMKRNYYIPKSTAFLLQGTATDPDDSVLYYHWESADKYEGIVNKNTFGSTRDKGPIMRDYDVTTDNFRYIPKLERILQGKLIENAPPTDWETVPSVARTLNFAFVVRDKQYYSGEAGYITYDTVTLQVTDDGPFSITNLNTASSFARGSKTTIQWDVAGTNTGNINAQTVSIKFSADRGQTWTVLHSNVPNTGSYEITFPNTATTQGRIMIKPNDNIFLAINTADITLT